MYTTTNFKTKKALKEAVAAFKSGRGPKVTYFQPGIGSGSEPQEGTFCSEGPHYPEPHKWYAEAEAKDGGIISVK